MACLAASFFTVSSPFLHQNDNGIKHSLKYSHRRLVVEPNLPIGLVAKKRLQLAAQVILVALRGFRELFAVYSGSATPLGVVHLLPCWHAVAKESPHWSTFSPGWNVTFPVFADAAAFLRGWCRRRNLHDNIADRIVRPFVVISLCQWFSRSFSSVFVFGVASFSLTGLGWAKETEAGADGQHQ